MADETTPDRGRLISLIDRLTELNSRHLKSEGRRCALELQIARCEDAMARGEHSADLLADLEASKQELAMVEQNRREIDEERTRLNEALAGGGA